MKKNEKTFQEHLQEVKRSKEHLPTHKMDDVSRRAFIMSVGTFLGGLMVPSVIRLETMSKLSKKIFGSSTAFAAGFATGPLDLHIYTRAGMPSRYLVGFYGDDGALASDANIPWDTVAPAISTDGYPVILPPTSVTELTPFANAIQHIVGENTTGHTEYFQTCYRAGVGELLSLRAATEDDAGYQPLLSTPFVFGDAGSVAVKEVPSSLAKFTPVSFTSVANAYQQFSPLTMTTNQNNTLTNTLRNSLLGIVSSKFDKDIKAGVLQRDSELITSSGEQTIKILKSNFSSQLNPANNTATMNLITGNGTLGSQGRFNVNGMNPAEAMFVMIQQAVLGIGPMTAAMIATTGDWHSSNAMPSGTFTGDDRFVIGAYMAKLFGNTLAAAQSGTWDNPGGGNLEIRIHVHSEFSRTLALGGADDTDNGDGQGVTILTMGSNINQTDFKPGCFGGTNASSAELGFNPTNNNPSHQSASIAWMNPDKLFGHNLNLLKIKKSLFDLEDYEGLGGDLA